MTTHLSGKFIIPISYLYLSREIKEQTRALKALKEWHPTLDIPIHQSFLNFDPLKFHRHGAGGMNDERLKHKSLIVLSEYDRLPPNMETDFVLEYFRPVLTLYKQKDGTFKGILKHRALIVPGAKGHAHAPYGPDGRMEDVVLITGSLDRMTDEEYDNRYHTFLPSLKMTT